jgi:hypothetical protein
LCLHDSDSDNDNDNDNDNECAHETVATE